uniref:Uncharacterized protein n=1 Tax=Avena sativa TaxID=4498 RepID=A0ACD5ZQL2_AVESA
MWPPPSHLDSRVVEDPLAAEELMTALLPPRNHHESQARPHLHEYLRPTQFPRPLSPTTGSMAVVATSSKALASAAGDAASQRAVLALRRFLEDKGDQIMEANNSKPEQAHEFVGAQSSIDIDATPNNNDGFGTPRKTATISQHSSSSFTPECAEELKPVVGMIFDDVDSVEEFYKSYAHGAGFGVQVGQQKKRVDDVVIWKRFLCDRQGFKSKKALQCQRQEELIADNTSIHTTPQIMTTWEIEKQGSEVFTHEVFDHFQKEVLAAREYCDVQGTQMVEGMKVLEISDASNKVREVQCNTSTMIAKCSCMLFESKGIPCRHIIRFLRASKVENTNEQLRSYVIKRWEQNCKRNSVYDSEGNLLAEKPVDPVESAKKRKISDAKNKFESLVQIAKNSEEGIDFLASSLLNMEEHLSKLVPSVSVTRQQEHEAFLGCSIPTEVGVLPPTDVRTKGRCKRIKGHGDKGKKNEGQNPKAKRKCGSCKEVGHNSRKCPNKNLAVI